MKMALNWLGLALVSTAVVVLVGAWRRVMVWSFCIGYGC